MNTDMIWETSSTSSAETERLGALLGKRLKGGEVIELRADLGGGKTTFVKGLVRGAGSQTAAASPTFTLNRQYGAKNFTISHFDFYRLDEPGVLEEQLAESFENGFVVVVEWANIVEGALPDDRLIVEFGQMPKSPDERTIKFIYPSSQRDLITGLETAWQEVEP